ncbi:LppU/SCO3897 family protein [Yinghuangia seranimata]|uniref:LppU/SCO3897 family protein n=1 Tax=Yinghuangia seranimata TaxID=408067 RepID=UPI00248C8D38|nr:hypothetical protein [Yinghuangia seranimata]MDI2132793.1 hypothetical protein [Yinghuangia seranimata]
MAALLIAGAAAYPVYLLVGDSGSVDAGSGQAGTCLAPFGGFLPEAQRPATVDCASAQARWMITAVLPPTAEGAPCRNLAADKGYQAGFEWRDGDGKTLCLTMTPNTTYEDFDNVGTQPWGFNRADFDALKQKLLAATGQNHPGAKTGG